MAAMTDCVGLRTATGIDYLRSTLISVEVAGRGSPGGRRLIPEEEDSALSGSILEIGVAQINAGIDNSDNDPFSGVSHPIGCRSASQAARPGGRDTDIQMRGDSFRRLHIEDIRKLRNRDDGTQREIDGGNVAENRADSPPIGLDTGEGILKADERAHHLFRAVRDRFQDPFTGRRAVNPLAGDDRQPRVDLSHLGKTEGWEEEKESNHYSSENFTSFDRKALSLLKPDRPSGY